MHRFYVETPIAEAGVTVTLSAEESAHAARVLRLRPGAEVRLLDDENLWEAVLESVDPKETTVQELGLYMAGAKRQGEEAAK